MSHTVAVKVDLRAGACLAEAVAALEGTVLGEGEHRLYQGPEQGFGFQLPGWRYPLVLKADGSLAYDDFKGRWGCPDDLIKLKERYAIAAAKQAAEQQGWLAEEANGGLLIYHPDGGTLTVKPDGTVDANNFTGSSCTNASEAIEAALGSTQEQHLKESYFAERAHVTESGG